MEAADAPSEDGKGWLGIDRFDVQLAIAFGVLSAVGWAVITGANSTPVGRIGFAAIGAPIGVLFGLRTGWFYRDSGPTGRAFLHWMAYVMGVLVVSAAVSSGRPSVDTLLAASVAVPAGVLVGRNLLEKRGDRRLGAALSPLVIAVVGLLIVVEREGGGAQLAAGVGLGVALVVVVCLDIVSRRSRVATGVVPPMPPRTRPRGWRLWLRIVGVVICLTGAAASLSSVEVDDHPCGSLPEALRLPEESDCAGEARFQAFGGWVLAIGAVALLLGALRGRPGASQEAAASGHEPVQTDPPPALSVERTDDDPAEDVDRWPGVLVLAAFLLIIGAQIVRVTGVVSDGFGLILVSIGLAGVAAVLLLVAVVLSRRRSR